MYLVFDIGGTFIKHAVMDSAGTHYLKSKAPDTEKKPERSFNMLNFGH
ncbi:hypothetical protein [Bacillus atrophaeus]|nr:hypothetical protein [Bacillus atrophaeus]KYD03790.1 hypothetical protein B4144_4068 [Bacillus atrophaeus]